ncbi:methyltransferase [Oxalobacteraceae bacterium]|nr:methyltransferase [Oxalobacteraceae bacterium]
MAAAGGHSSVSGTLSYLVPQVDKPYNYMYTPPEGTLRENCRYEQRACDIVNARAAGEAFSLETHGFELHDAPSQVRDFYDPLALAEQYFPEVEALACALTGGSRAVVFDHKLRMREPGRPPLSFGRPGDGSEPAAVGRVHIDYSEASGKRRLGLTLPTVAAEQTFVILNFWRPILHPASDTPLAVCDARTMSPEQLVASDIIYPKRTGEIYLATYSAQHRWYYYPEMAPNEVLVFKHYDSRTGAPSRRTPHCAFDDPTMPADAPLRRSIEVRCLVLLD